jgi:hypothetical protein
VINIYEKMRGDRILAAVTVVVMLVLTFAALSRGTVAESLTSRVEKPVFWRGNAATYNLSEVSDMEDVLELEGYAESESRKRQKRRIESEDSYIASLPWREGGECGDKYRECKKWAESGECMVNPGYMLYNCAESCGACKLSSQQKYSVTEIINERPPAECVYHGRRGEYPSVVRYTDKFM